MQNPKMSVKGLINLSVSFYNNTIHSAMKFTPNEVLFASKETLPLDLQKIK